MLSLLFIATALPFACNANLMGGKSRRWKLVTTTSSDSDAGTRYKVFVRLYGSLKENSYELYTIQGSQLHIGQEDTFYLNFTNDIGDIAMLRLENSKMWLHDHWKIGNSIVLTNLDSMKEYHFRQLNGMLVGSTKTIYPDGTKTADGSQRKYPKWYYTKVSIIQSCKTSNLKELRSKLSMPNVNVDETDGDKRTCLHWAASNGADDIARLMLDHGASMNLLTAQRKITPLHEAAYHGHLNMIKLLARAGAKLYIRNAHMHTAGEVAKILGYHEIEHWLTECSPSSGKSQPCGNWGAWAAWSDCSVTCKAGIRTRTRQCDNPPPGYDPSCPHDDTDRQACELRRFCPAKCVGGWAIHACFGGNHGKRSSLPSLPSSAHRDLVNLQKRLVTKRVMEEEQHSRHYTDLTDLPEYTSGNTSVLSPRQPPLTATEQLMAPERRIE